VDLARVDETVDRILDISKSLLVSGHFVISAHPLKEYAGLEAQLQISAFVYTEAVERNN
jgi:hypothetical protein